MVAGHTPSWPGVMGVCEGRLGFWRARAAGTLGRAVRTLKRSCFKYPTMKVAHSDKMMDFEIRNICVKSISLSLLCFVK